MRRWGEVEQTETVQMYMGKKYTTLQLCSVCLGLFSRCMHVCERERESVCMYVYIRIHIYAYIRVYVYIYRHVCIDI